MNLAPALLDGLTANCEPKAEPAALPASLLKQAKQFLGLSWRETTAFVSDFDQHTIDGRVCLQRHGARGPSELECVLQQVCQCRREVLSVYHDRHSACDGFD